MYLVDKKNLRPFQTYFVVIFHVKIRKNVNFYKIDISRGSKTQNHSKQAISSELTIQTYQISENTSYLHDKMYLSQFQTSFVVIFYVKIRKNITICTKLTFQGVQKHKIIHNKH